MALGLWARLGHWHSAADPRTYRARQRAAALGSGSDRNLGSAMPPWLASDFVLITNLARSDRAPAGRRPQATETLMRSNFQGRRRNPRRPAAPAGGPVSRFRQSKRGIPCFPSVSESETPVSRPVSRPHRERGETGTSDLETRMGLMGQAW